MARQADLLSVEEARRRILERVPVLGVERVPLERALGRVLAADVHSTLAIPPFANSSMDGFALRSEDLSAGTRLRVVAHIAAGSSPTAAILTGECARIMTGAQVPPGADAVVPFEDVEDAGDTITLGAPVRSGACVRPAGQDVSPGRAILEQGTTLSAPQIALLAAVGASEVEVRRRPVIGILSTGDELVLPGQDLQPGQIYNSNSPMLAAAVAEAGGDPRVAPPVPDSPDEIEAAMSRLSCGDLILTSGGASVGDHDYIKDVVERRGTLGFWRVRVRPGKPLLLGTFADTLLIGLPGNPTSSMVTFELFVRPAIRHMQGAEPLRPELRVVVDEHVENRGGRETYARVRLHYQAGRFHARLSGPQDSAMLVPLARADGLLRIPADCGELREGDEASVLVWRLPPRR